MQVTEVGHDGRVGEDSSRPIFQLDLQASRGCSGLSFTSVPLDEKVFELKDRRDVRIEVGEAQVVEVVDGAAWSYEPG